MTEAESHFTIGFLIVPINDSLAWLTEKIKLVGPR